jgi:hypothetical protein
MKRMLSTRVAIDRLPLGLYFGACPIPHHHRDVKADKRMLYRCSLRSKALFDPAAKGNRKAVDLSKY